MSDAGCGRCGGFHTAKGCPVCSVEPPMSRENHVNKCECGQSLENHIDYYCTKYPPPKAGVLHGPGSAYGPPRTKAMSREKAPWQEWFVQMEYGSNRALVFYPWELNRPPNCLHMLEKTNYDALAAELSACKAERDNWKSEYENVCKFANDYEAQVEELKAQYGKNLESISADFLNENDKLQAKLATAEAENAKLRKRGNLAKAEFAKWKADNNVE